MSTVDAFGPVVDVLEELRIPYVIVGALTVNLYAIPRSTKDLDIIVDLGERSPQEIASRLGPNFKLNPQMSFETVTGTPRYTMEYVPTQFDIELFILRDDDGFQKSRFSRRRRAVIQGREVWVPTPEDTLIMKPRWGSTERRPKDLLDVESILKMQQAQGVQLDWDYIHHWCDIHGTRTLLDQIRASLPSS